jgi:hypothetical protein
MKTLKITTFEARQTGQCSWVLIEHNGTCENKFPFGRVVAIQLTQEDCERIAALLNVEEKKKKEGL